MIYYPAERPRDRTSDAVWCPIVSGIPGGQEVNAPQVRREMRQKLRYELTGRKKSGLGEPNRIGAVFHERAGTTLLTYDYG